MPAVSKVDLYQEISRLKGQLVDQERLQALSEEYKSKNESMVDELERWKSTVSKAVDKANKADLELREEKRNKYKIRNRLKEVSSENASLKKQLKTLKALNDIDKKALHGQVKRARKVEAEAADLKYFAEVQDRRREEAAKKLFTASRMLDQERSLRLQDVHKRNAFETIAKRGDDQVVQAEKETREIQIKLNTKLSEIDGLTKALEVFRDIEALHLKSIGEAEMKATVEIDANAALQRELNKRDEALVAATRSQQLLEREVFRLQTELLTAAKANKSLAQENARLRTASRRCDPPISTTERHKQVRPVTSSTLSQTVLSRRRSRKPYDDPEVFVTPLLNSNPDRGNARTTLTSLEGARRPQTTRSYASSKTELPDYGAHPVQRSSGAWHNREAFDNSSNGSSLRMGTAQLARRSQLRGTDADSSQMPSCEQDEPSDRLSLHSTISEIYATVESDENVPAGQIVIEESDKKVAKGSGRPKTMASLHVPGSIFVGSGLGLRKESDVSNLKKGSAKMILKQLLQEREERRLRAIEAKFAQVS